MALIKCNECGHMISDRATKCPKCGCPTTKRSEPHIPQETPQEQPVYYEEEEEDVLVSGYMVSLYFW